MATVDVHRDSESDDRRGSHMDSGEWRVYGNRGQMLDAGGSGVLSLAKDDDGVNTCMKGPSNAPGFEKAPDCVAGSLSGAKDGAAASRRSAKRLAEYARNAGHGIEDSDSVGRRIA